MKILLVMPGVGRKPGQAYVNSWKMEPLSLAVLAAITPPDVEVRFADDRLEPIPYDEPVDAVAINVETYTARRAYAIAARFRSRGIPVVLGGYHPTLVPEEAIEHADAIVEGEAEEVWPRVIDDLRGGRLSGRYRGSGRPASLHVRPRREIFAGNKYLPVTLIEASRGCRFGCEFCSVSRFYDRTVLSRPVDCVVEEIDSARHRTVFFVDDNIVADPVRAKRLFAAMRPSGVRWISQGGLTMADDPEMLRLMRRSGCRGILVGFESLSETVLDRMNKSWNRAVRDYEEAIRRIRDAGLAIYATFVFGYEDDDADAIARSVDFAIRQKFHMAAFNHLVPFPGTPLYARLEQEGRLLYPKWWLSENYRFGDVAFRPPAATPEQLARGCFEARKAFYRTTSVLRRAANLQGNCRNVRDTLDYLWLNLFSGRQMQKRQGLPLGDGFDDEVYLG